MAEIAIALSGNGASVNISTIVPLDSISNKKKEPLFFPVITKATVPFAGYSEIQQPPTTSGPVNTTYWITG